MKKLFLLVLLVLTLFSSLDLSAQTITTQPAKKAKATERIVIKHRHHRQRWFRVVRRHHRRHRRHHRKAKRVQQTLPLVK